jgi:hypothetical protein
MAAVIGRHLSARFRCRQHPAFLRLGTQERGELPHGILPLQVRQGETILSRPERVNEL